jgi:hypothetical protein
MRSSAESASCPDQPTAPVADRLSCAEPRELPQPLPQRFDPFSAAPEVGLADVDNLCARHPLILKAFHRHRRVFAPKPASRTRLDKRRLGPAPTESKVSARLRWNFGDPRRPQFLPSAPPAEARGLQVAKKKRTRWRQRLGQHAKRLLCESGLPSLLTLTTTIRTRSPAGTKLPRVAPQATGPAEPWRSRSRRA